MIRFGILSTARINERAIIKPVEKIQQASVVAIASRTQERALLYAQGYSLPKWYGTYEELLADDEIDAVYISTPNSLHATFAKKALMANKHVLCEKPLSISYGDAMELIEIATQKNLFLMEALHYQYHPVIKSLLQQIHEGVFGEILQIEARLGFNLKSFPNIRLQSELQGGAFTHMGCYCIDFISQAMDTQKLSVRNMNAVYGANVDLTTSGILSGDNSKSKASFWCSLKEPKMDTSIEVIGTKGKAFVLNGFNAAKVQNGFITQIFEVHSTVGHFQKPSEINKSTYDFQLEYFLERLNQGNFAPVVRLKDTILVEEIYNRVRAGHIYAYPNKKQQVN